MEESSPCLLRSFSHPSRSSHEANEGHLVDAFGDSVSFGKFLSETLDWVKFSTFTQNRYLEEAEKCLKPGLVAQKKAYFESYFKDIAARRAAALAEEASIVTTKIYGMCSKDIDLGNVIDHVNIDVSVTTSPSSSDANAKSQARVDISSEQGTVGSDVRDIKEGKVLVKERADRGIIASANKKKHRVPSLKSLMNDRVSNIPPPPVIRATLRPPHGPSNTDRNSKNICSSIGKKGTVSNPIPQQIRNSRVHAASCKIHPETSQTSSTAPSVDGSSKDGSDITRTLDEASVCSSSKDSSNTIPTSKREPACGRSKNSSKTLQTLARASVCGTSEVKSKASHTLNTASVNTASKKPPATTKPEDRRTKAQLNKPVSGATAGAAVRKSNCQSANAGGNKSRSTTKAVPFSFRVDERAAKRKKSFEKMEEKSDDRGSGKGQVQTESKRKTEASSTKPRQSTNTGLKTNPRIAPHKWPPNKHSKKIPSTQPRSPKLGRKPVKPSTSGAQSSKQALEKGHKTTCSVAPLPKKKASENASPNIRK